MYCQAEYMYQTPTDFQGFGPGILYPGNTGMPPYQQQNDGSMYSPATPDRPSPSFRIEEILSQKTGGHPYAMYGNGHYPQFTNGTGLPHGYMLEKEYQGIGGNSLYSAYFRLKPNIRTPGGRKCRKPRTVFSELQLMVLEREFTERKYLSTPQRTKLAERLGLNQTQVKTWYQNRRMKWKKETNETDTKKLKQMSIQSEEDEQDDEDEDIEEQLHNNGNNNNNIANVNKTTMLSHHTHHHHHHTHHQHHPQHHHQQMQPQNINTHPALDTNFLISQTLPLPTANM